MPKPRIKFVRPYFHGITCRGIFMCSTPEAIGVGETPFEAYQDWLKTIAKTHIGRWFQRMWNYTYD